MIPLVWVTQYLILTHLGQTEFYLQNYLEKFLGYSRLSFKNANFNSKAVHQRTSLSFKHNQRTSQISIERNFSPTATSSSQISTSIRYNLNHSFNPVMNGNVGISQMFSEVFINNLDSFEMKQFGFDVSLSRILSKYFTTMFSYNYNLISRNNTTFNRHLISASLLRLLSMVRYRLAIFIIFIFLYEISSPESFYFARSRWLQGRSR